MTAFIFAGTVVLEDASVFWKTNYLDYMSTLGSASYSSNSTTCVFG